MRLYLSSYRTQDTAGDLLDLAGGPCRAVVISNAVDMIPPAERQAYARKIHDPVVELRDAGLDAEGLDLRDYFGAHTFQRVDKAGTFHHHWHEHYTK